jgi:hypothetical protein
MNRTRSPPIKRRKYTCARCGSRDADKLYIPPAGSSTAKPDICNLCVVGCVGVVPTQIHGRMFRSSVILDNGHRFDFGFTHRDNLVEKVLPDLREFLSIFKVEKLTDPNQTRHIVIDFVQIWSKDIAPAWDYPPEKWPVHKQGTANELPAYWGVVAEGLGIYSPELWERKMHVPYDPEDGFLTDPHMYVFWQSASLFFQTLVEEAVVLDRWPLSWTIENLRRICSRAGALVQYAHEHRLPGFADNEVALIKTI